MTGIAKRRIGTAAVMDYFSPIPNLLYNGNRGRGAYGGPNEISIVKRSIVIDGNKISGSLEDPSGLT